MRQHYSHLPSFQLWCGPVRGQVLVANFRAVDEAVEVFGQAQPTRQQHAYQHLLAEHAVLEVGGPPWRPAVLALRRGLKTEPAFAHLLSLAEATPAELIAQLAGRVLPAP